MICLNAFRRLSRCLSPRQTISLAVSGLRAQAFHKTCVNSDVMEFFDDPKNWGESEVKTGREWRADELRIKSNSDLHKLWYVLYKERNMLKTMEEAANDELELMPSPERVDKVEQSMKNLELVVRERNKAYWELEVGEGLSGDRPKVFRKDIFGRWRWHGCSEHLIPYRLNTKWRALNAPGFGKDVEDFNRRFREMKLTRKRTMIFKQKLYVRQLMRRFPDIDVEYLSEKFPEIDFDKEQEELEDNLLRFRRTHLANELYDNKKK